MEVIKGSAVSAGSVQEPDQQTSGQVRIPANYTPKEFTQEAPYFSPSSARALTTLLPGSFLLLPSPLPSPFPSPPSITTASLLAFDSMSQMARVMRLALVAMLFVVVLTSSQVSADRVAHQPRNAHPGLRKAMFGRRSTMMPDPSDPDCPEGEENGPAHLQEVAQRLADTSEKDGGKEETYDAVVPGPQGETHVDVRARSEVGKSGSHRSWSWSSSTHSSSHSSSSSSFNSSSSSSSSTSSDMPLDASNGHPSGHHAASAGEQHHQSHSGQGKKEPAMQMEVRSPPRPRARPQEVEGKETVVHASHSRHTSDTTKSVSTSEDDGDGKVKKHKTETKTHDSSSSSSYKSFTNVFHYVISGDMQHSDNGAPCD